LSHGWSPSPRYVEDAPHLAGRDDLQAGRVALGQPDQGVDRGRVEERDRGQVDGGRAGRTRRGRGEHGVGGGHVDLAGDGHHDPIAVHHGGRREVGDGVR
jgi:hypothetical protein